MRRLQAASRIFQGILAMTLPVNDRHPRRPCAVVLLALCAALLLGGCRIGNSGWYIGRDMIPRTSHEFVYYAMHYRDLNAVKELVESGDIGVNEVIAGNIYEKNLLHFAVYARDKDIINYLVGKGADLNMRAVDADGATPLHAAISYGYEDIALQLLDLGADPAMTYDEGKTACFAAHKLNRETDMTTLIARLPGCKDAKFVNPNCRRQHPR